MVLPTLVAVTIGLAWLLALGAAQVRTVDAARETARALARGDDRGVAVDRGVRVGVNGTRVTVVDDGAEVVATAEAHVDGPGGLFGFLPGVRVRARAVAAAENAEGAEGAEGADGGGGP